MIEAWALVMYLNQELKPPLLLLKMVFPSEASCKSFIKDRNDKAFCLKLEVFK